MYPIFIALILLQSVVAARSIEVFVALCDNKTQGIVPVGKAIGDGDDAPGNLYWGCSDGLSSYFKGSSAWKLESKEKPADSRIIETLTFSHQKSGTRLTAHAYRGSELPACTQDFFVALAKAGPDNLVAYIGHNGFMDTRIAVPPTREGDPTGSPAIVLCCVSEKYFASLLSDYGAKPLLLTRSLMYPGAFILHEAIEVWLQNGDPTDYLQAAAKAYAKNQKISVKGAKTVFSAPDHRQPDDEE